MQQNSQLSNRPFIIKGKREETLIPQDDPSFD